MTAWAESLGGITYPLLSDFYPHGKIANLFGVLRPDGRSERAIFVIDKNGMIRYAKVHDIDEQPDNDELFKVLAGIEGKTIESVMGEGWLAPLAGEQAAAGALAEEWDPTYDVVLYCTPWCPACRRARAFLQEYNVNYKEIDITRDRPAGQRVRGWARGYETTPTFDVKGNILVEFNRAKLAEMLGIRE